MEKRCGCQAHIVVNLDSDKKYQIVSMVEDHNHDFVLILCRQIRDSF